MRRQAPSRPCYQGRLELTWTNKDQALLAHEDGSYEWVPSSDYRVAEVRLLHDVETVGDTAGSKTRARDNLLIRGDALYALTSLAELPEFASEYLGKVKLAYLDPPFNTQQAFEHYDDALEHSVWLTMMRDRLVQIKRLLAPDGSVWVHLDDTEVHRARCVLDEIFGDNCFAGSIIWRASDNSNNDAKRFSEDHNVLLVYSKSPEWTSYRLPARPEQIAHFSNPDGDPNGAWFDGNPVNSPNPRQNLMYTVTSLTGYEIPPPPNGWRWSRETLEAKMASGEIRFTADGKGIRRRTYLKDHPGLPASSLWTDPEETGHNRQAKYDLKRLFPHLKTSEVYSTPKPERLMRKILLVATSCGDIVLDPFVGSGTTAAAAHKLGRRWVGIEWSPQVIATFTRPRLEMVVEGQDPTGITELEGWKGGGGFRVLDVAPSMFAAADGLVFLADWATNSALGEATAAQLGFSFEPDPPFCGRKGRSRLAVIDGLVNVDVVRLLVDRLEQKERLLACGTAVDSDAADYLRETRRGSVRKIPAAILRYYERPSRLKSLLRATDDGASRVPEQQSARAR